MSRSVTPFSNHHALQTLHGRAIEPCENLVSFGSQAIDSLLGGGLKRGGLHEVFAASSADSAAASAFAAMLSIRAIGACSPLLWFREDRGLRHAGRLYAPGLCEIGCDPGQVITIDARDTLALLRAGAESVKCAQAGAIVLAPWGKASALDLTASRRLAMAAAASGVFTIVVRIDAMPLPSAAHSRWRIAAAPSTALAANAPGHPAFDIALLRHRGGVAGFEIRLEWHRDSRNFAPTPARIPGHAMPAPDRSRQAA